MNEFKVKYTYERDAHRFCGTHRTSARDASDAVVRTKAFIGAADSIRIDAVYEGSPYGWVRVDWSAL